jgi:hypothetical protein
MSWIEPIEPEKLDAEQRRVFDAVVGARAEVWAGRYNFGSRAPASQIQRSG